MNFRTPFVCLCLASSAAIAVLAQPQQRAADHPAIAYATSAPADRIARLQATIDSGAVALEFDQQRGYLPSLLRALEIPVSSQGLVFSRTSLQVDRIAPWTPRAVYFSDDAYVGAGSGFGAAGLAGALTARGRFDRAHLSDDLIDFGGGHHRLLRVEEARALVGDRLLEIGDDLHPIRVVEKLALRAVEISDQRAVAGLLDLIRVAVSD